MPLSLNLEWLQCRHQDTNSCRITMLKLRGQILLSKGSFLPPKNCKCAIWYASSIRQRYRAVAWNSVYFKRFAISLESHDFCCCPWYCIRGKTFPYRNKICLFPDWINLAKSIASHQVLITESQNGTGWKGPLWVNSFISPKITPKFEITAQVHSLVCFL